MTPLETLTDLYGEDLAVHQQAIEAEAYEIGAEKFLAAMAAKAERGEGADTRVSRPLIADMIPKLMAGIEEFLDDSQKGSGRRHAAAKFLRMVPDERTAFITLRSMFNTVVGANSRKGSDANALIVFAMNAAGDLEDEARFGRIRDQQRKNFDARIKNNIAKRSSDQFKRAYIRAVEASILDAGEIDAWEPWSNHQKAAVGLKLVELTIMSTGLFEIVMNTDSKGKRMNTLVLTPVAIEWLEKRTSSIAEMSPMHSPCVVPPKPWTSPTGGGYWFSDTRKPLSLIRGSIRRNRRYRDVEMPRVYDAINAIQDTPWMINSQVLEVARAVVGMQHSPVTDMPSAERELPEKSEDWDGMTEEQQKAWRKAAARVYKRESARQSRRYRLEATLWQAGRFAEYERIWFPYTADFRGRIYALPTFSPQGSDLDKGLLKFADAPEIGVEGVRWLKMHGANVAGFDKEEMDDRIKWVDDNEDMILAIARDPLDNLFWATEADSPFCFLAFCFEYAAWKETGPSYRCGLPIAFDGSCSGIQHFSAMLRDEVGGKAVNLIPSDRPQDIYRIVSDKVNVVLEQHAKAGTQDALETKIDDDTGEILTRLQRGTQSLAQVWLAFGVTRKVTKRSVMTLPYGSKKFGFTDQLLEDIIQPAIDKHGEDVFPDPHAAARYMAGLIWDALKDTVVAAVGAMDWLQKVAGVLTKENMPCHWVTPVGFPVWQEYRQRDVHLIDTIICGGIRIVMSVAKNASQEGPKGLDRHKQCNGISPNFVHSMDASHLMLTVLDAKAKGAQHFATIHDSFGTAPGHAGLMFASVRSEMVRTYSERDVIQDFYDTFAGLLTEEAAEKLPSFPEKGNLNLDDILNSLYCFA